jgi:ankyrin repeat protein
MSQYGNLAHVGTFNHCLDDIPQLPIRSDSLLHIAVMKSDLQEIDRQLDLGIPIDLLATDGLAPLHWSVAADTTSSMQHLITKGAAADVRSLEGATPMMNAVQANKLAHLSLLIQEGSDVNTRDNRGFTALHRAAEMGHTEALRLLLAHDADPAIEAEGHTPLSLAEMRGSVEIAAFLQQTMSGDS